VAQYSENLPNPDRRGRRLANPTLISTLASTMRRHGRRNPARRDGPCGETPPGMPVLSEKQSKNNEI
jgi:hypothetical protein